MSVGVVYNLTDGTELEREFPSYLNPRASNLMSQLVDPTEPWSTVNTY